MSSISPADLFAVLFDQLDDEPFRDGRAEVWYGDTWVTVTAREISAIAVKDGGVDRERIDRLIDTADERAIFAILLGLDDALSYVNPFEGSARAPGLASLSVRTIRTGDLSGAEVPGALLYRCSFPGRPLGQATKDAFFGLVRVSADVWRRVDQVCIEPRYDIHCLPDDEVTVACAPVLETFDDVSLTYVERGGRPAYRLSPSDAPGLRDRIRNLLAALDGTDAKIAVLPEAALSKSLLEHWLKVLKTSGRGNGLTWLMLGSGPVTEGDPPVNRAVLVHRPTGHVISTYDKVADFTITADQLKRWALTDYLGQDAVVEDIHRGDRIRLLESEFGRVSIAICEDLGREADVGALLTACGVSHVLVPIFSSETRTHGWELRAAANRVTDIGAWVIVSNSMVIARHLGQTEPIGTSLAVGPHPTQRGSYALGETFGTSTNAASISTFPTRCGMVHRYSDFIESSACGQVGGDDGAPPSPGCLDREE